MSKGKLNSQQAREAKKPTDEAKHKIMTALLVSERKPSIANQSSAEHCKPSQIPGWKVLLDIATVVIGSYAVIIYSGQWNAAREANRLNGGNFRASQRAWVGSIGFDFVPIEAEKRTIFKNSGNSPAMSVEIRDTAQLVGSPRVDPTIAWMLTAALPNAGGKTLTMFNGQTYTDQGGRAFLLYPSQVQDISQGRSILVYTAEITYRDVFGTPHKTMLCQVLDSLGTHGCGFGEEAD